MRTLAGSVGAVAATGGSETGCVGSQGLSCDSTTLCDVGRNAQVGSNAFSCTSVLKFGHSLKWRGSGRLSSILVPDVKRCVWQAAKVV